MDDLRSLIAGDQPAAPVNNPGNLRPVGSSTGFQQFNTPEAGIAASDANLQAYGKKGINTLRGAISRWAPPSENDTEAYIADVSKRIGINPDQTIDLNNPVQRHLINSAMMLHEQGPKGIFAQASQPAQEPSGDPLRDLIAGSSATQSTGPMAPAGDGRGSYAEFNPAEAANTPTTRGSHPPGESQVGLLAAKAFGQYQQGKQALGERVAGAIDTAYSFVPAIYGAGVQALARTVHTPEEAAQIGQAAAASIDQPIGKAIGVTSKQTYQNPLGGITTPVAEQINKMFNNLGMTPEQISEKTGIPAADIRNMVVIGSTAVPKMVAEAAPVVSKAVQPLRSAAAEATSPYSVAQPGPVNIAEMQAQFAARKAGSTGMASGGAAATTTGATVQELLTRASPELQAATKTMIANGERINPAALENRIKAEQFGLKLTAGEASQDLAQLSEEFNSKKTNPAMADYLSERNPKLAQGFQDVRARVAPDVYEPDPVKASNIALENMVQQDQSRRALISRNYQAAADTNGGELPLSGQNFVATAEAKLKEKPNLHLWLPPEVRGILDSEKANGNMSYNNFEYYRTLLGNEARTAERAGKANVAFAIGQVRDALETTPMSSATGPVKALYDVARNSAKNRFDLIKNNPAYKAAISDTRLPEEIAQGVLHPAANKFVDTFYGPKTPQVNIKRLVNILGKDSESHQGLNAAVIDKIAQASGIKGGANDVVRQADLNKQVRTIYQTNLPSMLPPEGLQKLHDLADVAALTEHVKPGTYANVSGTAIAQTPSPAGAFVKKAAEGAVHTGITAVSPALGVAYGLAKAHLTGRAATRAAEAEAAAQAAKNAAPFKEGAGVGTPINKVGK